MQANKNPVIVELKSLIKAFKDKNTNASNVKKLMTSINNSSKTNMFPLNTQCDSQDFLSPIILNFDHKYLFEFSFNNEKICTNATFHLNQETE